MLNLCRFVPGLSYRLRLDPGGSVALIAGNGVDILFYAQYRAGAGAGAGPDQPGAGQIVLNSAFDRVWEAEVALPLPVAQIVPETGAEIVAGTPVPAAAPLRPCDLGLRLAGNALEVEAGGARHLFARFDAARAAQVQFVQLLWADDIERALVWRGETLEAALVSIEAHLLHRRMDAIERRLGRDPLEGSGA